MKTISLLMLALILASAGTDTSLSKKEIKFSTKYIDTSMSLAISAVENLSPKQWNYRPNDEAWTIAEICEHMLIAEKGILGRIQNQIVTDEANRQLADGEGITNEELILRIKDRSPDKRVKTGEQFEPSGILKTPQDFIKQYSAARKATQEYLKTTDVDLTAYYGKSPLGLVSAYQWTLIMSAHAERHTGQIVEVQSSANYPK
ncbi:MAG: DinB family protein [Reichenbachiella sp.]|uniref:DinB family protein n=1 Tax=Reichenbachiella sp. TaxID=2184521 RepID=UPI003265FB28